MAGTEADLVLEGAHKSETYWRDRAEGASDEVRRTGDEMEAV